MIDELLHKAKVNLKKRKAFQIILTIYACTSVVLFLIGTQMPANARFWTNFPTLIFLCVLAIIYVSMFGFRPMREALNEEDEELEKEILRLYDHHTEGLQLRDDLSFQDKLELEDLEKLREKVKNKI